MKIRKWVFEYFLKSVQQGEIESIKIACFKSDGKEFYNFIKNVLSFIKSVDPKRYNRTIRELQWISNTNTQETTGKYNNLVKLCSLNYEISNEVTDSCIVLFSSVIVHEATHGLLYSKGFKYTEDNREQVERICFAEENRFLKKAEVKYPEIAKSHQREFNPDNWVSMWESTKWQRLIAMIKRVIKS